MTDEGLGGCRLRAASGCAAVFHVSNIIAVWKQTNKIKIELTKLAPEDAFK